MEFGIPYDNSSDPTMSEVWRSPQWKRIIKEINKTKPNVLPVCDNIVFLL